MRRSDVQFKAKVEDALFPEAPVIEATAVDADGIPEGWEPLPEVGPDYPYDGQPVWVTEDGVTAHPATWRTTRAYDAINVKWVHESYWARRNSGGQRIEIIPIAFKKLED